MTNETETVVETTEPEIADASAMDQTASAETELAEVTTTAEATEEPQTPLEAAQEATQDIKEPEEAIHEAAEMTEATSDEEIAVTEPVASE
jgi:hypothetical protein